MFNNLYLLCATVGGTVLVVQTILLLFGAGGDADSDVHVHVGDMHHGDLGHDAGLAHEHGTDHHHHGDSFLKLLSFKTVVAFITFFGLAGLACTRNGIAEIAALFIAVGAGSVALYIVAYLMAAMYRLQSKGNLDLRNAVGGTAKVYLRVPGERSGQGKVLVAVQGRKVECKAVTSGPEIPTGAEVRIVGLSADTAEVIPVGKE
jgi:hypothetical protein